MDFLKDYLRHDLARVQQHIEQIYTPEGELMRQVADYVKAPGGKLLRPSLVALFARGFGYDARSDGHARLGASVELFHVATLLHDDVIDGAQTRRGRPSVNARFGADCAILFADYLYASCFDLALSVLDPEVMRILTRTTARMTEGEMFQIERRGAWLTEADYFRIVRAKTAYLFGACAGLGALIGGASSEKVLRATDFGVAFGLAFQITDDALDYDPDLERWGKPVGNDVREGKQTLPLILTLAAASADDRAALEGELNNGRDFATVYGFVKKYAGLESSLEKAAEHTKEALEILDALPLEADAVACLRQMTEGVLVRQF